MAPCESWVKDSKERKKTWPDPAVDRQSSGHRARSMVQVEPGRRRTEDSLATTVQIFGAHVALRDSTGISSAHLNTETGFSTAIHWVALYQEGLSKSCSHTKNAYP